MNMNELVSNLEHKNPNRKKERKAKEEIEARGEEEG